MKKRFNITGACLPGQHYMADASAKFARVMEMVEQGDYFTINRPRQYGKTTLLFQLLRTLNQREGYTALGISFEGIGEAFGEEATFCPVFLDLLKRETEAWGHPRQTTWTASASKKDSYSFLTTGRARNGRRKPLRTKGSGFLRCGPKINQISIPAATVAWVASSIRIMLPVVRLEW